MCEPYLRGAAEGLVRQPQVLDGARKEVVLPAEEVVRLPRQDVDVVVLELKIRVTDPKYRIVEERPLRGGRRVGLIAEEVRLKNGRRRDAEDDRRLEREA